MRIQVSYLTRYRYQRPVRLISQVLRMTPRGHDGQHVLNWRVEIDGRAKLHAGEDAFGNLTHGFTLDGPVDQVTARVFGEIETWDTGGVVQDAVERFPPTVFLRDTALTQADGALRGFALDVAEHGSVLDRLHALLVALHREVRFETDRTDTTTTAGEAFALRRGVCQDLAHIFIAAARVLGAPARYISGHLARTDAEAEQTAAHAWAEAHVAGLGWVGFDPANGVCPTDAYVRVAAALDYLGAAPVRGSRYGGAGEHLDVRLHVAAAGQ